ncbi:hypothetical protein PHAVU_005G026966 [Phaseolus vulgaris]
MANFKKLILNMVMVFVILLSMNLAAAARVPLWISQSHHKPYGRLLLNSATDPQGHNYYHPGHP